MLCGCGCGCVCVRIRGIGREEGEERGEGGKKDTKSFKYLQSFQLSKNNFATWSLCVCVFS